MSADNRMSISSAFDTTFNPALLRGRRPKARAMPVQEHVAGGAMPPELAAYTFTTDQVPVADRFEAWRRSFAPMVEVTRDAKGEFRGTQVLWDLGGLAFPVSKRERCAFPAALSICSAIRWTTG